MRKSEIHIWRVNLNPLRQPIPHFRSLLTQDEIQRADQFIQDRDRNRFILGRGALRSILSTYTHLEPGELRFEYGPKDKPALAESLGERRVSFNLSHSHDQALLAIAHFPRRVGVDLEGLRDLNQLPALLERYLSVAEQEEYAALPPSQQKLAFFHLWSRKEAFVKAWGESLGSVPLHQLEVSFTPNKPAEIRTVPAALAASKNWWMQDLALGPEYAGCLVAELLAPDEKLSVQRLDFIYPVTSP